MLDGFTETCEDVDSRETKYLEIFMCNLAFKKTPKHHCFWGVLGLAPRFGLVPLFSFLSFLYLFWTNGFVTQIFVMTELG